MDMAENDDRRRRLEAHGIDEGRFSSQPEPHGLGSLIAIAVVIAAGCGRCAERMVDRALGQGVSGRDIRLTLGIVEALRGRDCFVQAVGEEIVARMEEPLETARKALRASDLRPPDAGCCA